jgi:hypothetical protein
LTPECQQLLRSLERATAGLADLHPREAATTQETFEERERAIKAIAGWIAAEHEASRPVSPELAQYLTRDLEQGDGILARITADRENTRLYLAKLGRELQVLRGLNNSSTTKPSTIDYQG